MYTLDATKFVLTTMVSTVSLATAIARADDTCERQQPSGLYAGIQLQLASDATFEPTSDPEMFQVRFGVYNDGDTELPVDGTTTIVRTADLARQWYSRPAPTALFDEATGLSVVGINPGRTTIVEVALPATDFQRCSSLELTIDPYQGLQTACDAFADDSRVVRTPCLTWTTPLTAEALGTLAVYDAIPTTGPTATLASDLDIITIEGIVSSWWVVRPDGNVCSHCHYANSPEPNTYKPQEVPYRDWLASPGLQPDKSYSGWNWDDVNDGKGWALQFLGTAHPAKPRYLKLIFERWVRDGMRATPRSSVPPLRE